MVAESTQQALEEAIELARALGDPTLRMAILAEGNVSVLNDEHAFWVKVSGAEMRTIAESGFVKVRFAPLLRALDEVGLDDVAAQAVLTDSMDGGLNGLRPSVETFMHAGLLRLPEIRFVGHTHPDPLLSILCTRDAEAIARQRLFPDEVVCCGPESVFVAYADPGLPLARAIMDRVEEYADRRGEVPKTIWLQNHGLIALGRSAAQVKSASLMAVKAAQVWLGALSTGREIVPMSEAHVNRIHTRPDEHYRQSLLWQMRQRSN